MARLDTETLKGLRWVESEIHHARFNGDMNRIKNLKRRLSDLQDLLAGAEEDVKKRQAEARARGEEPV
jgi:hypothetical protein